jgi:hypothetical protein
MFIISNDISLILDRSVSIRMLKIQYILTRQFKEGVYITRCMAGFSFCMHILNFRGDGRRLDDDDNYLLHKFVLPIQYYRGPLFCLPLLCTH